MNKMNEAILNNARIGSEKTSNASNDETVLPPAPPRLLSVALISLKISAGTCGLIAYRNFSKSKYNHNL